MALGYPFTHPRHLKLLTPSEIDDWREYFLREPFGQYEVLQLLALLNTNFYNANRAEKAKPLSIEDLLPSRKADAGAGADVAMDRFEASLPR